MDGEPERQRDRHIDRQRGRRQFPRGWHSKDEGRNRNPPPPGHCGKLAEPNQAPGCVCVCVWVMADGTDLTQTQFRKITLSQVPPVTVLERKIYEVAKFTVLIFD